MFPTPEMIEAGINAQKAHRAGDAFEGEVRDIITAALALLPGEPDLAPLTISYPVHEIAHNLLIAHTGMEGGCPKIDWYKLRAEISDAIAVALDNQRRLDTPPAPAPQPASVKALEWVKTVDYNRGSERREQWMAKTAWGNFTIWNYRLPDDELKNGPKFHVGAHLTPYAPHDIDYPSLEAAKAAAQADYESRIRSALSSPVEGGTDNEADIDTCPVCSEPLKANDLCSTDIELGVCHAACLEGSPTVNLDTGEQVDGPIPTYRYGDLTSSEPEEIQIENNFLNENDALRAEIEALRVEKAGGSNEQK